MENKLTFDKAMEIIKKHLDVYYIKGDLDMDKVNKDKEGFIKEAQLLLDEYPDLIYAERFQGGMTGLSEDMEDFMLEQDDHYFHNKTKFWSSFYRTCVGMFSEGVDLSDKQISIIEREYNKVKDKRIEEYNKKKVN